MRMAQFKFCLELCPATQSGNSSGRLRKCDPWILSGRSMATSGCFSADRHTGRGKTTNRSPSCGGGAAGHSRTRGHYPASISYLAVQVSVSRNLLANQVDRQGADGSRQSASAELQR